MATTVVPVYAQPTAGVAARGGPDHLDRDMTAGYLQVDALGRPAKVKGVSRLVSRIVRAYLTYQGTWWANPSYGSVAVPTYLSPSDVAIALSSVALIESKVYGTGRLAPDEKIASIKVVAVQQSDDARDYVVDVEIATSAGIIYPQTLQLPGV